MRDFTGACVCILGLFFLFRAECPYEQGGGEEEGGEGTGGQAAGHWGRVVDEAAEQEQGGGDERGAELQRELARELGDVGSGVLLDARGSPRPSGRCA